MPTVVIQAPLLQAEVREWVKDRIDLFHINEGDDVPCLSDSIKEMN